MALPLAAASTASAELAFGITGASAGGSLFSFNTSNPAATTVIGSLSGIVPGHAVRAIDFRPATGQLYAMSTSGTGYAIYTVNLNTAALSLVGTGTVSSAFPTRVSIDFNPVVDRIRVVTSAQQNLRIHPDTGALIAEDTPIAWATGQSPTGSAPFVADLAYTGGAGSTSTTMYVFDYNTDYLATQGSVGGSPVSPNSGQLFAVGPAVSGGGFLTSSAGTGMDISVVTGIAYLSYDLISDGAIDQLGTIDLSTGLVTPVGNFNLDVLDISVVIPEPSAIGLLAVPALALVRRRRA